MYVREVTDLDKISLTSNGTEDFESGTALHHPFQLRTAARTKCAPS